MTRSALIGLLVAAVLLGACGLDDGGSTSAGDTELRIELRPGGPDGVDAIVATLRCAPPSGDLPDPVGACSALGDDAVREALPPVPPATPCTEIWGGPETARITGTVDGEPVDVALNRSGGCEIARWDALAPLLPPYTPLGVGG